MKNKGYILILIGLLVISSCNYQQSVNSYMQQKGYTNIILERQWFGTCCDGIFGGCKGYQTWTFIATKDGRKRTGKVCWTNCWPFGKKIKICEQNE